ncbi:hypothetical protein FIV11_06450 [Lactiplantibacillus plantarum]|uniref:acyltransferase family protein n=1 Tax=Lactiplantibacillus plantarum TaxID=1590 RepID=UPI0026566E88|nr:acyltransferase family protein [Lactiplantibacillus plantarum]MDN7061359.1 hypothetical protein [Lactiplantibacillus plantarum]
MIQNVRDKPKRNRIENIDVLRGVAIVLMVMGHVGFGYVFDKYIHVFHMPIWFFISGYFFKNIRISFKQFIVKKLRTLIFPYVVWGVIQYLFWLILVSHSDYDAFSAWKNLFWINTNELMPIAGALWFLTALFFSEIMFQALFRVFKNFPERILFISVMGISIFGNAFISIFHSRLPWSIDVSFVATGFYYLGYLFSKYKNTTLLNWLFHLNPWICASLFFVNGMLDLLNGYVNLRIGMYGWIPLFWLNALTAIILYWNISNYICGISDKNVVMQYLKNELVLIGKYSIVYLCLNQLMILLTRRLFESIDIPNINILVLFVSLGLLFVFRKLMKFQIIRRLFGARK